MKISRNYHSILVSQMVFPVPSSHIDNSGHDKHCQMNNVGHEKQTEEKMKTFKLHYNFRKKSVNSEPTFPKFNTFFSIFLNLDHQRINCLQRGIGLNWIRRIPQKSFLDMLIRRTRARSPRSRCLQIVLFVTIYTCYYAYSLAVPPIDNAENEPFSTGSTLDEIPMVWRGFLHIANLC